MLRQYNQSTEKLQTREHESAEFVDNLLALADISWVMSLGNLPAQSIVCLFSYLFFILSTLLII